jgi:hypothetical protein
MPANRPPSEPDPRVRRAVDQLVTMLLFRPVGPKELERIRDLGYRAFPPRLAPQPIFYPVLNEDYARQIARDWNAARADTGYRGYVTRFEVDAEFASRYPVQTVGGSIHRELWVPAEELDEFNAHIVGEIEVIAEYAGGPDRRAIDVRRTATAFGFTESDVPPPAVFLDSWHGRPALAAVAVPDGPLPRPIRELWALAQRWPRVFVQNELVLDRPADPDTGRRVFYDENQSVHEWATDGVGDDPVVWSRRVGDEPWRAEHEPLSRFLLQVLVFESVSGAPHAANAVGVGLAELEAALGSLRRLPLAPWRWPADPTWFYAGDDVLAVATINDLSPSGFPRRYEVWFGARSRAALAFLQDVAIEWAEPPH